MITLTETAAEKIKSIIEERKADGKAIRVFAEPGGCSGMRYGMAFDSQKEDDDVVQLDGVSMLLDPTSAMVLKDGVIDYVDGPHGSGFEIKNPNVTSSCGNGCSCG